MMRIACMLAVSASFSMIGGPIVLAQIKEQAPDSRAPEKGTIDRNQNDVHPMERGVIRPPESGTLDHNQTQVPGTRDDPNVNRDSGQDNHFDRGNRPRRPQIDPDRNNAPHQ